MSGAIYVGIVAGIGLVLESCSVDGDSSCLLLWSFINFAVFDILGLLLTCQIFCDGGGKSGLAVIDVSDCTN
jgi:hypothetical protein